MPEVRRAVGVGILPLNGRLGERGRERMAERTALIRELLAEGLDPEYDAPEILRRLREESDATERKR